MKSFQLSVTVSHLQVCQVQWILSSCLLLSYISKFVQSSELFPAVCYCFTHLQFCPVQSILSSPLSVSHISRFVQSSEFLLAVCYCLTSPVLSSPMNSIQSFVSVSHLQVCPVHWILSSCLLLSRTFPFLSSPRFYCLMSPGLSSHCSESPACSLCAAPFCFSFLHFPLRLSMAVTVYIPLKPSNINDTSFLPSATASFSTNSFTWKIEAVVPPWCRKEQNTLNNVRSRKTLIVPKTAVMTTWKLHLGHYV